MVILHTKKITIDGHEVDLFSNDKKNWSSDPRDLEEMEKCSKVFFLDYWGKNIKRNDITGSREIPFSSLGKDDLDFLSEK